MCVVLTPLCDLTSLRAMTNNLLYVIWILRLRILCDFKNHFTGWLQPQKEFPAAGASPLCRFPYNSFVISAKFDTAWSYVSIHIGDITLILKHSQLCLWSTCNYTACSSLSCISIQYNVKRLMIELHPLKKIPKQPHLSTQTQPAAP